MNRRSIAYFLLIIAAGLTLAGCATNKGEDHHDGGVRVRWGSSSPAPMMQPTQMSANTHEQSTRG